MSRDRSQFSLLFVEFFKPQAKPKPKPSAPSFFRPGLAEMMAAAARPVARGE